MPRIRPYVPQINPAGPVRTPESPPISQTGQGLQAIGEGVSKLTDAIFTRVQQDEISTASSEFAKAQAEETVKWQEQLKNADPNDKELGSRFMEDLNKRLQTIQDNTNTPGAQRYASEAAARINANFTVNTAVGEANLAAEKLKTDIQESVKHWTNALVSDPSTFQHTKELRDQSFEAMVQAGTMSSYQKEQLTKETDEQMALATAQGWIQLNPTVAKQKIKNGEYDQYISGEQKLVLDSKADQEIRGKEIEAERQRAELKRIKAEKDEVISKGFLADFYNNKLTVKTVLGSSLDEKDQEHFLDMISSDSKNPISRDDPAVVMMLFNRINAEDGDPNKITDPTVLYPYFGHGVSKGTMNWLNEWVTGDKTPEGKTRNELMKGLLKQAQAALAPSGNELTGFQDPKEQESLQAYRSWLIQEYAKQRQAGKSDFVLLTPGSKDYLGNNISNFNRSPEDIMRDQMGTFVTTPGSKVNYRLSIGDIRKYKDPKTGQIRSFKFIGSSSKDPINDPNAWEEIPNEENQ